MAGRAGRLEEVDYFRAFACLAVVLIHTTAGYVTWDSAGPLTQSIFIFVNRALTYAVPAFLFISGFVLFQRYREGDFAYFPFLKKRLRQIVLPYFLWTLFYYGLLWSATYTPYPSGFSCRSFCWAIWSIIFILWC